MRYGTINCTCGQEFYFESARTHVNCINCDKEYDITSYPEKAEEVEFTETDQNGTEGE
jgi:hypothetical protein